MNKHTNFKTTTGLLSAAGIVSMLIGAFFDTPAVFMGVCASVAYPCGFLWVFEMFAIAHE